MARGYAKYRKALGNLSFDYFDCPQVCLRSETKIDIRRVIYCEKCPRTLKKNEFKREVERLWEEWFGEQWEDLSFAAIQSQLHGILAAKSLPEGEISVVVQRYLNIYDEEKDRLDRMDRLASGI